MYLAKAQHRSNQATNQLQNTDVANISQSQDEACQPFALIKIPL